MAKLTPPDGPESFCEVTVMPGILLDPGPPILVDRTGTIELLLLDPPEVFPEEDTTVAPLSPLNEFEVVLDMREFPTVRIMFWTSSCPLTNVALLIPKVKSMPATENPPRICPRISFDTAWIREGIALV